MSSIAHAPPIESSPFPAEAWPPAETFVLTQTEELAALGHPLRIAILRLFIAAPHTNSQIAEALDDSRARVHFHVLALERAGLIRLVEERRMQNYAVVEKYYRAVARTYQLAPGFPNVEAA